MRASVSSSTSRPIDTTSRRPVPTGTEWGWMRRPPSALASAWRRPFEAEHAGDREAPDVGVDHADGEAPLGQGGGQVGGDGGLAHAALAGGDGEHAGAGGHGVRAGRPWAFLRAMPIAAAFCSGVISVQSMPTEVTPGRRLTRLTIVPLDLGAQRAAGGGEGEGDADGTVGVDGGGLGHPELDDVGPELGVDDPAEGLEDVVRGGDSGHEEDSNGVARVDSAGWKVRRRSAIPTSGIRGSRHGRPGSGPCRPLAAPRRAEGPGRQHPLRHLPRAGPQPAAVGDRRRSPTPSACTSTPCGPTSSACATSACSSVDTETRGTVGRPQHRCTRSAPTPPSSASSPRRGPPSPAPCSTPRPAAGSTPTTSPTPVAARAGPTPPSGPPAPTASTAWSSSRPAWASTPPRSRSRHRATVAFAHCPFRDLADEHPRAGLRPARRPGRGLRGRPGRAAPSTDSTPSSTARPARSIWCSPRPTTIPPPPADAPASAPATLSATCCSMEDTT